jgi:NAD(P)-dependent dehydrogenase (short-subunit alcohol dehydrogenase family)
MLQGKRVVVTGASRGIGRAIALAFAREGAVVAVTARSAEGLAALADQIVGDGGTAYSFVCDVSDAAQVAALQSDCTAQLGGVDILVNNAGSAQSHKFVGHPDALWHAMLAVNLSSVYFVSKAFAPAMLEQNWGRIINIASIAGKSGARYVAAYTAAKHGVLGLTRALAAEFATSGVTVNAICPGYVDTPLTDATVANIVARTQSSADEARAALRRLNPQGRLIEASEIAALALYLAGDHARGITGQAINVDGGAVMY